MSKTKRSAETIREWTCGGFNLRVVQRFTYDNLSTWLCGYVELPEDFPAFSPADDPTLDVTFYDRFTKDGPVTVGIDTGFLLSRDGQDLDPDVAAAEVLPFVSRRLERLAHRLAEVAA